MNCSFRIIGAGTSMSFASMKMEKGTEDRGVVYVSPGGAFFVELPGWNSDLCRPLFGEKPAPGTKPIGQLRVSFEGTEEAKLFGKKLIEAAEKFEKEWAALSEQDKIRGDGTGHTIAVKIK